MKKLITTTLILGATMIASVTPAFASARITTVDTTTIDGSVIGTLVTDSQKKITVSGGDVDVNVVDLDEINNSAVDLWLDTNNTDIDVKGRDTDITSYRDFEAKGAYVDTLVRDARETVNVWSRR